MIKEKCTQLKQKKNATNQAKKEEDELNRSSSRCESANSYTISNPVFPISQLPEAISDDMYNKIEFNKDTTIDEPLSFQSESEIVDEASEKILKNAQNETDKLSNATPSPYEFFQPSTLDLKTHLKELIDKQKDEYMKAMEALKIKFASEQRQLIAKLELAMQKPTSTPLTNNSFAATDDEEFTEFQTCLQSSTEEKTLVSDGDRREKAATIINAYARSYLVRRLMCTSYVSEHIQNIHETLNFVLNLNENDAENPLQDVLLKTKLFRQLQEDLYKFNKIFIQYSTKEKMKIIEADREIQRKKKILEENENNSF